MNDKYEFFDFENRKPPKPGNYLWAQNNWRAFNIRKERVLSFEVKMYWWNGYEFRDSTGHGIMDPDQWGFVPKPEKAEFPSEYINYNI